MYGQLGAVADRRRKMLTELGKVGLGGSEQQRMLREMGFDRSRAALSPGKPMPPQDNTFRRLEKWVQAALNAVLGTRLQVDGVLGGISRAALQRFQRQAGIAPHGFVDEKTLLMLELYVGLRAPRGAHEAIPALIALPLRTRWKQDVRQTPASRDKAPLRDAGRTRERPGAQRAGPDGKERKRTPREDVLEREAGEAVWARAFDLTFVRDEAVRLGAPPAAVQAAVHRWQASASAHADVALRPLDLRADAEAAIETLRSLWQGAEVDIPSHEERS